MKKIKYYILLAILTTATVAHAQYAGKKYISGSGNISFQNNNYDHSTSENYSSYGLGIQIGKFITDTKSTAWTFNHNLSVRSYSVYVNAAQNDRITDIGKFQFAVGRNVNFYKHFTDKLGIFGGPGVNLQYTLSNNRMAAEKKASHYFSLNLGVSGSMYYRLSDRWWIEASLAYANPISLGYSSTNEYTSGRWENSRSLEYSLKPQLSLPTVGLGLRYMLK